MARIRTLHEIVTQDRVYPADQIVVDMPKALIDELKPIGAIEVVQETAPVEVVIAAKAKKAE